MTRRQLEESLEKGEIRNQYLLVGKEPLLIDRALDAIKESLKVDESFDLDVFSLPDAELEEIMAKLFLMPFVSAQRLVVVRDLEEVLKSELDVFAETISNRNSSNCLVLTYELDRNSRTDKPMLGKLKAMFPKAEDVLCSADYGSVRRWIQSRVRRDNLNLGDSLVEYLEKEFSNDVTGLKNELDKIENYLYEAGNIDGSGMRDLAKGLCNLSKYQMVDAFMNGNSNTLQIFEELQPSVPASAVLVDALTRGIVFRARRKDGVTHRNRTALVDVVAQLAVIDRKVKTSSVFERLSMELFILRNAGVFKNGVLYGR